MSDYWTESFIADAVLEQEREEAELREWEVEQLQDRLHRDDPIYRKAAA